MTTAMIVFVTTSTREEALAISRTVVAERLAAAANVFDGVRSIYWWDGQVNEAGEAAFLLKTTQESLPALITRIRNLHAYDCPSIIAWPVAAGNPDYLAWIEQETSRNLV